MILALATAAVKDVVVKYGAGLLRDTMDPDDPEMGFEAFRTALKEAGIDTLREDAQNQYKEWKNSQW